jgi:hypothetical protein
VFHPRYRWGAEDKQRVESRSGRLPFLGRSAFQNCPRCRQWRSSPGADSGLWFGIVAPAGTSSARVAHMAGDLEAVVGTADTRAKLATRVAVLDFVGP